MAVVVLCPMEIERKAVARELRAASLAHIAVVQTGIGKEAVLQAVAQAAEQADRPSMAILAGACGGLVSTDDVPAIAVVIDEHGGRWHPAFADPAGVRLVGVDRIIASPPDKRGLADSTKAAIVDMETHAFAAECERLGLAWTVVRGVSDTPEETLPAEVLRWVRPDGGTFFLRAAWDLLRKPWLVPHIISVVRRANRVLPKVGARVAEIVREVESRPVALRHGGSELPICPLPIPDTARVAIFVGGTFDPPHRAHVELPVCARDLIEDELGIGKQAWLVYVPAAHSPHKADGPIASNADRVEMLRIALRGVERVVVWDDEIARAAIAAIPSYTIDTLRRARAWLDAHGRTGTRLRLLIGADQAAAFYRWKQARAIMELAEPVVMVRGDEGGDSASVIESMRRSGFWSDAELDDWGERVVDVGRLDVSSSAIRASLAAGRPLDAAAALPDGVAEYIRERGLYGPGGSPESRPEAV